MKTNIRLEDVNSYELFDTPPDQELDEITELASIICGTPISLITILDDKRQWFKSNKGLDASETKVEDSFCQHALHKPDEVLVVNDALKDERFIENKLVLGDPNIRFYAGAPLVTKKNNVLGTLCIIDRKPRQFSKDQERALQILAKKAMDLIERNKIFKDLNSSVKLTTERLIKITQNIPLGIFEIQVSNSGDMQFVFLSDGMTKIHPEINLDEWIKDPNIGFSLMHPDDIAPFQDAIALSIKNEERFYHEYRVKSDLGYGWHSIYGVPDKTINGQTLIYGAFTDISHQIKIEGKNKNMQDSITYAKRIQKAMFPPNHEINKRLPNHFILYKPKDIISGDFYWMESFDGLVFYAAADCTGHGVPGAVVSVLCVTALNRSVREFGLRKPGKILDKTRELLIEKFERSGEDVKDGMDISLCALNTKTNELLWSGANNPLWIMRQDASEIEEIKADKQPIGKYEFAKPFTTHKVTLNSGDKIYTFSDGYVHQFGGERDKKLSTKTLKELLLSMKDKPMEKQHSLLVEAFEGWKGKYEQVDDLCIIGVRV